MKRRKKKDLDFTDIVDLVEDLPSEESEAPWASYSPEDSWEQEEEFISEKDEQQYWSPVSEPVATDIPDIIDQRDKLPVEDNANDFTVIEESNTIAEDKDEEGAEEEELSDDTPRSSRKTWLVMLLLLVLIIAGGIAILFYLRDSGALSNIQKDSDTSRLSGETKIPEQKSPFDLMAAAPEQAAGSAADDGETIIVALGNAPFSDDRDSDTGLANLITELSGATVYNCSVDGSYLCAESSVLSSDLTPMDAFNLYWLTTSFCQRNNKYVYEDIFRSLGENMPSYGQTSYDLLQGIDFNKVDVIAIMYDASDYLAGHSVSGAVDSTDIRQASGNLGAAIELISQTYPHIRIIVMSPTYAQASGQDGDTVSSATGTASSAADTALYGFVSAQYETALKYNVTFVDNYHGAITGGTAAEYLLDNLHLGEQGREYVAERFVDALQYFTNPVQP